MLLGIKEAKDVEGIFYEFQYKTIVRRNEKSEHFGCFKNNDKQTFEMVTSIFMRSLNDYLRLINSWRCLYGIYEYAVLGMVSTKSYRTPEIINMIYQRNNFKFIPYYNNTTVEYIQ